MGNKYDRHGLTNHPLYRKYHQILGRCYNKNEKCYNHYGGRGIQCEWKKFIDFFNDMSPSYKEGLEIDRIDVNGNYSKENCRWATRKQQMNNYRRNTIVYYDGNKYTISELADKFGINRNVLKGRVSAGITGKDLLFNGHLKRRNTYIYKSKLINGRTVNQISKELGISKNAVYYRIRASENYSDITRKPDKFKGVFQPKLFFKYEGERYTLRQLSEKFNIKYDTLWSRIYRRKMSLIKALNK